MYRSLLIMVASLLFSHITLATEKTPGSSQAVKEAIDKQVSPSTAITASARQTIENQLRSLDPDIPIETIEKSPVSGLYVVSLKGDHILYVSNDGQYLIRGDMLEIKDGKIANLTTQIRNRGIAEQLSKVDANDMIIFSPKGETKGIVYAFTDLDCGYCRKLHNEIAEMNELGIELRYLAYPRGGNQAPSYTKMVSAWCANDRKAAISDLNNGHDIPEKSCTHPIESQVKLGKKLGISGTPSLFLEDGRRIPGYRSAKDLARLLKINKETSNQEQKTSGTPAKAENRQTPPKDTDTQKRQVAPAA